jgi:hypothetical protein
MAMVGIAPEDDDGNAASRGKAVKVAAAPKGYDGWLDDLYAVADEGTPKLEATWKSSPAEFRSYLTSTAPKVWESIKAKAAKALVTA